VPYLGRMSEQPSVGVIPEFTVGERLRKAREVIGLDQDQLGDEIAMSRNSVSNYETGATTHLKPIYLRAWALRTGVPLSWLVTGIANPQPNEPTGGGELPRLDSNQQPSGYRDSQVSGVLLQGPWGELAERRAA